MSYCFPSKSLIYISVALHLLAAKRPTNVKLMGKNLDCQRCFLMDVLGMKSVI